MFIKLNYTSNKFMYQTLRVLTECINNTAITSVATLSSTATAGGWDANLVGTGSGFDSANSTIVRTTGLTTALTKAHFAGNTSASSRSGVFTLEQSVFDSTSTKYYVQIKTGAAAGYGTPYIGTYTYYGTAIGSGSMTANAMPPSSPEGNTVAVGTPVVVNYGGSASATYQPGAANTAGHIGGLVYTAWFYISDTCFLYYFSGTATTVGFPSTFTSDTTSFGTYMISQYSRYDYWNTAANGMIPVIVTQGSNSNNMFTQWVFSNITNPVYAGQSFSILTSVNGDPRQSASVTPLLPVTQALFGVCTLVAGRSSGEFSLIASNQVTTASTQSYAPVLSSSTGAKVVNATLTGATFYHLPLGWEMHYYGYMGGSMSEISGIYIFSGDFTPGDEYTVGSTTYCIWPVMDHASTFHVGIAIPKQ